MKLKLIYNRKNKLLKDGTALVQIRVSNNYHTKYISTGIYLLPDQWDAKKQKVIKHNDAVNLNVKLNNIYNKYAAGNRYDEINGQNFISWIDEEIKNSTLATSTIAKQNTLYYFMLDNYGTVEFKDISHKWVLEFKSKLDHGYDQRYRSKKHKLKESTKGSMLAVLKRFVNKARALGYISEDVFNNIKIKKPVGDKVWLTIDEIKKISNYDTNHIRGNARMTRDAFVFSCYTGLRFKDLKKIKGGDLDNNILIITPSKTEKHMTRVILNLDKLFWGEPLDIFNKYAISDNLNLFHIHSKSDTIKYICKEIGINKNVSWHTARHSFAMNLLNLGLRLEAVSKLLGHKSISTTQIYAKMLNQTIDTELDDIFI